MESSRLSLDARYLGAWNEINTRITQRQALISIYTSLTLAALGAPLLQESGGLWRLAYAVAPLSVLFAMLLRMHERMIQLLNAFLAECETRAGDEPRLSYYAATVWTVPVARARRIHDWVCFYLVLGINSATASVVVFGRHTGELSAVDEGCCIVLAATAAASLWLIYRIGRHGR